MMYLEGEEPDVETLKACIRKGCLANDFCPMLCGTAFKNKGVQPLLDAVLDYLPAPTDLPPVEGVAPGEDGEAMTRDHSDEAPFSGLAFKIMNDSFVGSLTFVRVYSGVLEAGTYAYNPGKGKKERIGRLLEMHANDREDIKVARAGDIVAVGGLKDVTTGDTLCIQDDQIVLERMEFPDPVIKVAIEPKTKADLDKMGVGLNKLAAEDPSFHYSRDEETNQTVIEGMGELHLEIIVDRLKREFKVEAEVGAPSVNYRESISRSSETKGGVVPKEYIPGVVKGLTEMMGNGVVAGYPVVDVRATLYDGSFHDVDSSVLAFQIAARGAFREGMRKAGAKILEPIMAVEVVTPEDHMGDVIGDLNSRRGMVGELGDKPGGMKVVNAEVPLAEMFNYVSNLRGMSKGRANYTMKLDKYMEVPPQIQQELAASKNEVVDA